MGWIVLLAGLLLWSAAHFFKRLAPERRAAMGDAAKGGVALAVIGSIALMWWGYRDVQGPFYWGRHPATVGVNNLLMVFAVYLFAASGMKTRITRVIRHPQLTAVKVWALAHLLVNGTLEAIVLFGGLLAWAVVEVIVINRAEPKPEPAPPAPVGKEVGAIVGALVVYAGIAAVHYWLGYPVFG